MEEVLKLLNENNSVQENLQILNEQLKGKIVFSTSFGIEDQVITNEIFSNKLENIEVFTLDTGRLFPETYDVWDKSNLKYGNKIKPFYPE
uniref:phosphoadenosine phosphosulfate reductase domain-containing protein n=1 Tax=Cloacibacterium sp. TaxID=1913682 RepID=UPI0035B2BFAB